MVVAMTDRAPFYVFNSLPAQVALGKQGGTPDAQARKGPVPARDLLRAVASV